MSTNDASRLAFIDSLRLLAAMLVVFQHLAERHSMPFVHVLVGLGPGVMGVVLFFLISGYVIPFSVRRGLDLRMFMTRRIFRIYPLFLAAIAGVAIGGRTGFLEQWASLEHAGSLQWIANLLLIQDFVRVPAILGVSWTLIIELIWYVFFAGALLFFGNRAARVLAISVPLGLLVLAFISLAMDSRIPLGRPAMIYAAVLGYQAFRYHEGALSWRGLATNLAAFLAVTWFTNWVAFGNFSHAHITLAQALGPWTIAPILFFLVILPADVRKAPLLNTGLLPLLGATSYSIYLLHPIANAAAEQYAVAGWQLLIALFLTLLLSILGYNLIEKPGIALGRLLANKVATGGASRPVEAV